MSPRLCVMRSYTPFPLSVTSLVPSIETRMEWSFARYRGSIPVQEQAVCLDHEPPRNRVHDVFHGLDANEWLASVEFTTGSLSRDRKIFRSPIDGSPWEEYRFLHRSSCRRDCILLSG